jgi:hypothetical protein
MVMETGHLGKHTYHGRFEVLCWRRMKIIWSDRVRNEEVLCRVKERIILHAMKKRKDNWIGNGFRTNCFLKHDF